MRPLGLLAALGAGLASGGCVLPRLLSTPVEVVTAADSEPAFGPRAELRALDETLALAWDSTQAAYLGQTDVLRTLRVARFKGDVYLFQAELEELSQGYTLILARVSKQGDVTPLSCDVSPASSAEYGVSATRSSDVAMDLRGDRAGIIGLMASALPGCKPLMRVEHWTPLTAELAAAAAAPGASVTAGCLSCPAGACVQGMVVDEAGAVIPRATVRVEPRSGSGAGRTGTTDEKGQFLVTGLGAGSYVVSAETTGFGRVVSDPPFTVAPGTTYLFEPPFELRTTLRATSTEPITVSWQPIPCRKGRPAAKRP